MRMAYRPSLALAALGALGLTFGVANPAEAFWWGSHGSSGGSHGSSGGSWGSSGGSYGSSGGSYSYGSSGGSYGSSGGSYGSGGGSYSYGSSGGSYGSGGGSYSYGSGGGSYGSDGGSYGSAGGYYGSGGGSYGSAGGYHVASNVSNSSPATDTRVAYLNVKVPAEAKVYLQGQQMSLTGTERRFVTPALEAGKQHTYNVKVEVVRDGRTLTKSTSAEVKPGQEVQIAVSFDEQDPKGLVASVTPTSSR